MLEATDKLRLDVRVRFYDDDDTLVYGKGINRLLQLCSRCHSLHKAADEMQMSYRKALQIVQRAEKCFGQPLLVRTIGGREGGGSRLTPFAERLVAAFSGLESELEAAAEEKWLHAAPLQ